MIKVLMRLTLCLLTCFIASCESKTQQFSSDQQQSINEAEADLASATYEILVKTEQSNDTTAQNNALQQTIIAAKEKGYPQLLFKAYNWFAIAYYKRGNYELSDVYTDSLAMLADSVAIPELRPLKNIELANKRHIKRTDSALHFYQLALMDSALLNNENLSFLLLNLSNAYFEKGLYTEAKPYVNQLVQQLESINKKSDAGWTTLLNGKSMLFQIYLNLKDTSAAFQQLHSSLKIIAQPGVQATPDFYADFGNYYLFKDNPDSALYYFDILEEKVNAVESKAFRVRPYLSKAKAYVQKQDFTSANNYLNKAKTMLQLDDPVSSKKVRDYIKSEFYDLIYKTERALGNTAKALKALEQLKLLDDKKSEEQQSFRVAELEKVLTEARAEKTITANELKIKEQKRYNVYITVATLLIVAIGWLLFRDQKRKRHLEGQKALQLQQKLELEKSQARLQAEDEERKRIAQEIHDDISPTITTLSIAAHTIGISKQKDVVEKTTQTIVRMTKQMSQQLNEIIWSLNSAADELSHLNAFIRKFAEGFLIDVGIKLQFESNIASDETKMVGYKRRAIYHCVKEILNNAVKYSGSDTVALSLQKDQEILTISIRDFGKGFNDTGEIKGSGNGLKNIENNIEKIGGNLSYKNDNGLITTFSIPLELSI